MLKTMVMVVGLSAQASCSILFMDRVPNDYKPTVAPKCSTSVAAPVIDLILAGLNTIAAIGAAGDPNAESLDVTAPVLVGVLFAAGMITGFSGASRCTKAESEWIASEAVRGQKLKDREVDELTRLRAEKAARDAVDLERLRREERERLEREQAREPMMDAGVPAAQDSNAP